MKKFIQSLLTLIVWPLILVLGVLCAIVILVSLIVFTVGLVIVLTSVVIADFFTLGRFELIDYWITQLLL